jgi:TatD DNase family protein
MATQSVQSVQLNKSVRSGSRFSSGGKPSVPWAPQLVQGLRWHHRPVMWIDSHCHLDAPEFDADRGAVLAAARGAGVQMLVLPAVQVAHFDALARLAADSGFAYALGIHPLYVDRAADEDLDRLHDALAARRHDPRLVAVGEIGLDHFVPGLDRARQDHFYRAQLKLARQFGLPVILHVRRSADSLLAGLRRAEVAGGIAHAFNGSEVQATAFVERGFKLGFGGAMTFERALQIRRLATTLPAAAPVLETDSPDIPPQWLYRPAATRDELPAARNTPAELPRIAATLAALRGWSLVETAQVTSANAMTALPRLAALMQPLVLPLASAALPAAALAGDG